MNDDNNKQNTLLLTVIAIATLLVAVVGATFAYFTAASNESSTATASVTAGAMYITFENNTANLIAKGTCSGDPEVCTGIIPSNTNALIKKKFTLTATNTLYSDGDTDQPTIKYTIDLTVTSSTFAERALAYKFGYVGTLGTGVTMTAANTLYESWSATLKENADATGTTYSYTGDTALTNAATFLGTNFSSYTDYYMIPGMSSSAYGVQSATTGSVTGDTFADKHIKLATGTMLKDATQQFELEIWFFETSNIQDENKTASFSGKIEINRIGSDNAITEAPYVAPTTTTAVAPE